MCIHFLSYLGYNPTVRRVSQSNLKGKAAKKAIQVCFKALSEEIKVDDVVTDLNARKVISKAGADMVTNLLYKEKERVERLLQDLMEQVEANDSLFDVACGVFQTHGVAAVQTLKGTSVVAVLL